MKEIRAFQNKKVLILGLAKSGEAAARLLVRLGALVTVNDGKPFDENPAAQSLLAEGIKVICGHHPLELLDEDFQLMVKNPGIRYDNPMVAKAIEKGIPIYTEVELAFLVSEAPIIGITGSNGKTTTTTMIADVLNAANQAALLSGNIGFPASEVVLSASEKDTLVMELSSFQLMGIDQYHPQIAVITNITPSHIDYHGDFDQYLAAKWRIQERMTEADYLVLNADQELTSELLPKTNATPILFSSKKKVEGAYLYEGGLYFKDEWVMSADQLGVPGDHNIENALATIAVAKLRAVPNEVIAESLSQFGGVKHRLQKVGDINQVTFYNDSKSTNILACQKALSGFDNQKVILIAGGLDRGNDFDALVPNLEGLKKMILLGESAPRMKTAAQKAQVPFLEAKDVTAATKLAFNEASPGDIVLLSPANASWDMYPNFEIRGEAFLAAFAELKGDK
ncbi:UDP-N-acetylmuramoyl-L-alanine--D-glutamate ligase [Streptococcus ictaluri]|uniref:UDP-N-acetylmuramoylalanine--D-glutamate ligase n=1 Tax=Streptococcus ictaluri 707-05 TaxID=764299 RepID=G5K5P9_9STRE|nr:UDP-N-acetylmuramoyl-L-alanine--D-glutamate ligase [Streptococcus ictaluri]EHI68660.1 UDP-N-acetylmuramoyl-L-alanine--D-glutamate ligase [Streptococcus ictaluri 707-05]